jgi:aminoglycoside 6'-N-acetyltransferase
MVLFKASIAGKAGFAEVRFDVSEAKAFALDGKVSLRLMRDDSGDYEVMAGWLSDERVLEFYEGRDNPFDIGKIREKYAPRVLMEEKVVPCFISCGGSPVGYMQYYVVDEAGAPTYGIEPEDGVYGVDMFIGEPDMWGQGIGTRSLSLLLDYLFDAKRARKVVIDPHVSNHRAIRCYEKCGFNKVRVLPKHELHEGEYRDSWLMTVSREREN